MGGSRWASTPSTPVTAGRGRGRGVVHSAAIPPAPATPPTAVPGGGLRGLVESVHTTSVAPPVVQDVQNQVRDDIQSPASTPEASIPEASTPEAKAPPTLLEAKASPLLETKASSVPQYVFNHSHTSADNNAS